ncbi:MAG: DUF167 domain-containing protein [Alphaproteobacteria bacterium]|mgnify:FL=1|nr:DUF167 domain-containing protein [Alphaproteobacteria bacterium]
MSRSADPFRIDGDDVLLRVRATPGARRPGLDGLAEGPEAQTALKVRVRAKAEDGKANADLIETLAVALGRPRSSLSVAAGASARLKTVRIAGRAGETAARLKELLTP